MVLMPMQNQTKPFTPGKDQRLLLRLSFALLALALVIIGFLIFLNSRQTQSSQLQPPQLQVPVAAYQDFIEQQFALARYEKTFELRQQYYSQFMGALEDSWFAINRKEQAELAAAMHQLAKSYYGLEPFLDSSGRHYLKKRIAEFQRTMNRLSAEATDQPLKLKDKQATNELIEALQDYLYPLLFESTAQ